MRLLFLRSFKRFQEIAGFIPIKQGLRHIETIFNVFFNTIAGFIPIKQGLRHSFISSPSLSDLIAGFIPIKQGLRHISKFSFFWMSTYCRVYSNKTRIATQLKIISKIWLLNCRVYSNKTRIATIFFMMFSIFFCELKLQGLFQ